MSVIRWIYAAILIATPVWAADDGADPSSLSGLIEEPEWREIAAGRTVTYTVDGEFFALERYPESGNAVSIQMWDGQCRTGHWSYVATGEYCFFWESLEPVCFIHRRNGAQIEILRVIDGALTGDVQILSAVSDAPLSCGALTS